MSTLEVIVGGQYGSEGKGAITAWRARCSRIAGNQTIGVRVAGPNAGHTVIGDKGIDTTDTVAPNLCGLVGQTTADGIIPAMGDRFAWRLRSVPVAAVEDPNAVLALAPGSEIDLPVLLNEIAMLDAAGYAVSERLYVDPEATLIRDEHRYDEKYGRGTWDWVEALGGDPRGYEPADDNLSGIATVIGSTGKGIGAARADRVWRVPGLRLGDNAQAMAELQGSGIVVNSVANLLYASLRVSRMRVLIEGTQGYGLGLHAGAYPFCTSSNCRAIDFLAMAGISPWMVSQPMERPSTINEVTHARLSAPALTVWVCLRPYPIRVGGNSGPLHNETDWETLGLPVEHTTVTGKVRRVGRWDGPLARSAIRANGGPGGVTKVVLTMMDTLVPGIAGWEGQPVPFDALQGDAADASLNLTKEVEWLSRECQSPIAAVGTGPDTVLSLED